MWFLRGTSWDRRNKTKQKYPPYIEGTLFLQATEKRKKQESSETGKFAAKVIGTGQEFNKPIRKTLRFPYFHVDSALLWWTGSSKPTCCTNENPSIVFSHRWSLLLVLIYISLMASDIGHVHLCLDHWDFFFWETSVLILAHFLAVHFASYLEIFPVLYMYVLAINLLS